jgi:hypothetical protein
MARGQNRVLSLGIRKWSVLVIDVLSLNVIPA